MQGIAVLPQGLENEGVKELIALGAKSATPLKRSVAFKADMSCFYRLHLLARLPFRFLREIARFSCDDRQSLYFGIQNSLDWERWIHPSMTFRVDVTGRSKGLPNSYYTALQVKNALVDLQRTVWGKRSDINIENPDICLHVHLNSQGCVLSLDGSARSLHRRGYRAAVGLAPLKENLAAGLMQISGWDGKVPLVDPLCGSGTLLIEAVSSLLGLVPATNRSFLFEGWADFDPNLWDIEQKNAYSNESPKQIIPLVLGCEQDPVVANHARKNIQEAGLQRHIKIQTSHFRDLVLPDAPGLIVCNPPYGKRIGMYEDLEDLYEELSRFLKKNASGWHFWLLSGNRDLSRSIQMKATKKFPISNGGIDCRWLNYLIN